MFINGYQVFVVTSLTDYLELILPLQVINTHASIGAHLTVQYRAGVFDSVTHVPTLPCLSILEENAKLITKQAIYLAKSIESLSEPP